MDETEKLFSDFNHRLNTIDIESKQINNTETSNANKLLMQKDLIKKEIASLREEFNDISKTTNELIKEVFGIGKVLKDKISQRDLDRIKERIESWKPEEYIQKDELNKTFDNYSKE